MKVAVNKPGIVKGMTSYAFRHSFALHLFEAGFDIRTIQELFVHKDIRITMICTHVLHKGGH